MLDNCNNALQAAITAHEQQDFANAINKYQTVLNSDPNHAEANHRFGILSIQLGEIENSLIFLQTAINVNPNIHEYWVPFIDALIRLDRFSDAEIVLDQAGSIGHDQEIFNKLYHNLKAKKFANQEAAGLKLDDADAYNSKGVALKNQGKSDEALAAFKKAISIEPDCADALNNMGILIQEQGKLGEAIETYKKALAIKPENAEAYLNMGNALQEQGKLEEAIEAYKKALAIKPDFAKAYYNMGSALHEGRKLDLAVDAYKKFLSIEPYFADAYNNMGSALQEQGKLEEALEVYRKAISINPNFADVYYNIGGALHEQGKLDKAIEVYKKAISIKPDFAELYVNMGVTLQEQGKLEKAIKAYNKALSIKPDFADACLNIGIIRKEQGKVEEAIEAYKNALTIKPNHAVAHRHLSTVKQYTIMDEHFYRIEELYKQENLSDVERCHLDFALAKVYEDIGLLDKAFRHLSSGNFLRKKELKYSIDQDKNLFKRLKKAQPYQLNNSVIRDDNFNSPKPIFILGMPRSGTTLIEQIISSHSMVTGAGELRYVSLYGSKIATGARDKKPTAIFEFRTKYLSELSKIANRQHFVTDKTPQNFRFIPLICAAFPEAKIIHVQRNAAATCWSNYKKYFTSEGLGYSFDLHDIVLYYKMYTNLMDLWQSYYGDRIYDLNYENLTTDQENETKRLIKNLGLDWEEECLSPHDNKRIVRTASQQQVRKQVYQGSSKAWREYKPYLSGILDGLV